LKVNASLAQINRKAASQLRSSDLQLQNNCLHSCCRSDWQVDNTRPWCGRWQPTTTLTEDQGGHLENNPTSNRKPVQPL